VTVYPTLEEILVTHRRAVLRFGGTLGVRDRGAIESALARPQTGYYSDVIQEAAALLESLSQNHPFLDGNKRTAIAVTAAFLRINGYRLEFDNMKAYEFLVDLFERNAFRFDALEKWLRENARPSPINE
jgi:death on curing protein